MAYARVTVLGLGPAYAGQAANLSVTLIRDPAGTVEASGITTSFRECGDGTKGIFAWYYAAFPAGFRGTVEVYKSGVYTGVSKSINPEDDEAPALIQAKTDNLPTSPAAVGSAMVLSAAALDAILVESGISAGAGLTNDTGTQLTSINARQALSAILSAVAAVLNGAATPTVTTKPGGKPAGNNRLTVTADADGNRSAVVLKVPD